MPIEKTKEILVSLLPTPHNEREMCPYPIKYKEEKICDVGGWYCRGECNYYRGTIFKNENPFVICAHPDIPEEEATTQTDGYRKSIETEIEADAVDSLTSANYHLKAENKALETTIRVLLELKNKPFTCGYCLHLCYTGGLHNRRYSCIKHHHQQPTEDKTEAVRPESCILDGDFEFDMIWFLKKAGINILKPSSFDDRIF